MEPIIVYALLIGITIMLSLYVILARLLDSGDRSVKKALAIFCGAIGLLSALWLQENQSILREYSGKIVLAGLGVVLALLAYARNNVNK